MKIGSASWIKRGTYLDNSLELEKMVDFVELLIYTWDGGLKDILDKELSELKKLSLFYTVHLPLDGMDNCRKAYDYFKEARFPVKSFTLHPHKGWENFIDGKPEVILENLIDICEPYERMCLDIGHLYLSKKEDFLLNNRDLEKLKEFHIHGLVRGKDHCVLNQHTIKYIEMLKDKYPVVKHAMSDNKTLLNFEIFDLKNLVISLRRINSIGGKN